MAGVLQFTLGLETSNFLRNMGIASGNILSLAAVSNAVRSAAGNMWEAVQKGGTLKDVAASANLTVKSLYQLQRGFEDVGASADSVPAVINFLRRQLASGEQNKLLESMGLDAKSIAAMDPSQQFEAITAAMAKMDVNARSSAAQNLFGRQGATIAMQIANSGTDFADAMKRASSDAVVWQNVSSAFDSIGDKVAEIKARIQTMWAGLAGALVQAFNEGKLSETLFDIFGSAFSALGAALPHFLAAGLVTLGEQLFRVFETPLVYLQSVLDASMQGWFATISKIPGLRDVLGIPENFTPDSWDSIVAENKKNGLDFFGANFGDMSKFSGDQLKAGYDAAKPIFEALGIRLGDLVARLPKGTDLGINTTGELGERKVKGQLPDNLTSLEKIGFVFNSRGSLNDPSRETATNTRLMHHEIKRTNQLLSNLHGGTTPVHEPK